MDYRGSNREQGSSSNRRPGKGPGKGPGRTIQQTVDNYRTKGNLNRSKEIKSIISDIPGFDETVNNPQMHIGHGISRQSIKNLMNSGALTAKQAQALSRSPNNHFTIPSDQRRHNKGRATDTHYHTYDDGSLTPRSRALRETEASLQRNSPNASRRLEELLNLPPYSPKSTAKHTATHYQYSPKSNKYRQRSRPKSPGRR
ncbi:hypothetical protein [Aquimarina sp. RZ0]|uniref:hypothetical protein n=1 Tax=Aquimarina sp. RZ0 TaxID=2607730 RepID=UPI0011F34A97|nr:hypothetical protein [Aquimarina sp. RZ0]KAA1242918.1 hypothetical protein F0000_23370 [Aquimarina sp. RZ0]